jgi:CheY-like chemotaxis protein
MSELQRVMCVEDDPDIRTVLQFSLGTLGGYQLCCCASGQQALDEAVAFAPQLVLLDVMMPGLSGPETLLRLRELPGLGRVPVVFVTAKSMPDELEALLACGATGLIVKPFDPMRLAQDVRPFWEHGRDPTVD